MREGGRLHKSEFCEQRTPSEDTIAIPVRELGQVELAGLLTHHLHKGKTRSAQLLVQLWHVA